jgi:L-lysine epsilon oxidase-like protein
MKSFKARFCWVRCTKVIGLKKMRKNVTDSTKRRQSTKFSASSNTTQTASARAVYKIHPAIGIARVGNADSDQFFIGPEIPRVPATGEPPGTVVPPFKDSQGRIKPQAARFRIWEYKLIDGQYIPAREVTLDDSDIVEIKWMVHLANVKASFNQFDGEAGEFKDPKPRRNAGIPREKLEIDPGPRTITGRSTRGIDFRKGSSGNIEKETWPDPPPSPIIDWLGELRTDEKGRLIVIGGKGRSATNVPGTPITHFYNNDHWFDDMSDGPVKAQITIKSAGTEDTVRFYADGAWVIVGPPDFAPPLRHIVTLYDTLYDVAAREMEIPSDNAIYDTELKSLKDINKELMNRGRALLRKYQPSFNDDIYPILNGAAEVGWVFESARHAHSRLGENPASWSKLADPKNSRLRDLVMSRVRPPPTVRKPKKGEDMPKLMGDEYKDKKHPRFRLSITHTQYALLKQWHKGKFDEPSELPPRATSGPARITPAGLDRASLENCVGGPFHPGLEVSWQIRHKDLYSEPFRINHNARSTYRGETERIRPGHFTRQMAVPWQVDFLDCKGEKVDDEIIGWWPAERPDQVFENESDVPVDKMVQWHRASAGWPIGGKKDPSAPSHEEMISHFFKFGFVVKKGNSFVETERASSIP